MYNFIAFDVETTGTESPRDRIVEIAAVRFINGRAADSYVQLVNPGCEIPKGAIRVHGITNEMVAEMPSIGDVLDDLTAFCGDEIMVAHNAPFDLKFLANAYIEQQIPTPSGVVLDTLAIARKVVPGLYHYKLGSLVEHFDISHDEFHRAEADAEYCGEVFMKLVEILSKDRGLIPLENLINLSGSKLEFPIIEAKPKQIGLFG